VRTLRGGGEEYGVYVHSYLGLGLMAARAAVLGAEAGENPCVAPGSSLNYAYAGKTHAARGRAVDDTPASCAALVKGVLDVDQPCSAGPADECGFAGVWSGGSSSEHKELYLSSYFFDRAQQVRERERGTRGPPKRVMSLTVCVG